MAETASKSIYNWQRYPSSNGYEIDENVQFRIRLSVVPPANAAEKTAIWMHNYSPSCAQKGQRYFEKFTFCMTFGEHKLVRFEPFLDSPCKV